MSLEQAIWTAAIARYKKDPRIVLLAVADMPLSDLARAFFEEVRAYGRSG